MTSFGDHRRSFRRGLFLGLTTAEVSILLVFVMLLLFLSDHQAATSDEEAPEPGASVDEVWRRGRAALRACERDTRAVQEDAARWVEINREAEAENQALRAELRAVRARLRQQNDALLLAREELRRVEERCERPAADLQDCERRRGEVSEERDRLRRRVRELERRLPSDGRGPGGTGSDHPSCWYDADGDVEYVWDVALHERGFLLRPGPAPANAHLRPGLPLAGTVTGRYITPAQFVEQTRPLYDWSVRNNCRFFVRAYDDTPATAKELYQRRMRTLEGHFYKNASPSGSPPRP